MARDYKMSWHAPKTQWQKMYKGERFTVTCSALGLIESLWTKEGSRQAANDWWTAKLESLTSDPVADAIAALPSDATILDMVRRGELASLAMLIRKDVADPILQPIGTAAEMAGSVQHLAQQLDKPRQGAVTVKAARDSFLALKASKKPSTQREIEWLMRDYDNLVHAGKVILSASMDIRDITESTVTAYYHDLQSRKIEPRSRRKRFLWFRAFVTHCWENYGLTLPRNLRSANFDFDVTAKAIKVIPVEAVRDCVKSAKGRLKLYALLCLNCGMNNVDIGSLEHSQIDWQLGYLTRKRVKTAKCKNAPTVTYKLWPETLSLLRKYRSSDPRLVLTSMSGTPLHNGYAKDLLSQQWARGGFKINLKDFRTFGSTQLKNSPHKDMRNVWKANVPEGIDEIHYSAVFQEQFDAATEYLRRIVLG